MFFLTPATDLCWKPGELGTVVMVSDILIIEAVDHQLRANTSTRHIIPRRLHIQVLHNVSGDKKN